MTATRGRNSANPKPKLEPDKDESKDVPMFKCSVIVYTETGSERQIDVGEVNEQQLLTVNAAVSESYDQLAKRRELFIIDTRGIGWHFNTDKIVYVEVRVS